MLKSSLAFLAFTSFAFAQSQTFTYNYTGLSVPVYPDDANVISLATISFREASSSANVTFRFRFSSAVLGT